MVLAVAIFIALCVSGARAGLAEAGASFLPVACPEGIRPIPCFAPGCDPCPGPKPGKCKPGVPVALCKADPCQVSSCPAYPSAKCTSNFCGGCNAVFTVGGEEVDCSCPPVNCFADPCTVTKCANFPNAECQANFCGGCNADFFVNGKKVECDGPTDPPSECTTQNKRCINIPTIKNGGCCKGLTCCACGPPIVREDTPPPIFGTCAPRCICPIG